MPDVVVVIGAGSIGPALARRVSAGRHVVLADLQADNAEAAAHVLHDAGFDVSTATVDVSSRASVRALVEVAINRGDVVGVIHAAGASPSQAPPAVILAVDLLALSMLQPERVTDPLHAYQLAKRGNSLRVKAEAVRWGRRGARVNTISPGIVITPLANDELSGPRGPGHRRMIDVCPVGRAGTPDEIGALAAFVMGRDGAFITAATS